MYQISQLMSTPVASSSRSQIERAGELSSTCIFPSFACDFLHGDASFDCCSIDPLTGLPCRRSPRLLTNGYYLWTEDSFLCDKDGNVTLSPSQTSVMYKENLVRLPFAEPEQFCCFRWFLGGMLAGVFTCSLMITIAYLVKSLCLSLASYFKATAGAWFDKI
ncbi:PREDICTED: transmembrane protein 71 [Hipposideros armiger]|uniref:Transmembrane protein 71 n=1 Tax=Hipposideros armiger TaxID=186990 RepID=A0A8B7S580_HIPAR|nr:PREDICTED: transmembrane protein 71 [Hipposideros armiger]